MTAMPKEHRAAGSRAAFTLIELLVTLALIAIISVVVVVTLNPSELLKQARDSNRLSDINTLNTAVSAFVVDQPTTAIGNASTTYVSVPDSTTTCANLGLPALPTGWSYHCAPTSTLRNVDGTGWLPVNFAAVSFGAPLSMLPIDPNNTTSTTFFYAYGTNASKYELTTSVESQKYTTSAANDGGLDPGTYEQGTSFSVIPFIHGLVGYWNFEDANTASTTDISGYGDTLNWHGTSTIRYVTGKVGAYAAWFGGNTDYLSPSISAGLPGGKFGTGDFTVTFWAKGNGNTGAYPSYVTTHTCGCSEASWSVGANIAGNWRIEDVGEGQHSTSPSYDMSNGSWHFLAAERSGTAMRMYIDGSLYGTATDGTSPWNLSAGSGINIGLGSGSGPYLKNDSIDDLRIYSRALSSAEISAIYTSTN